MLNSHPVEQVIARFDWKQMIISQWSPILHDSYKSCFVSINLHSCDASDFPSSFCHSIVCRCWCTFHECLHSACWFHLCCCYQANTALPFWCFCFLLWLLILNNSLLIHSPLSNPIVDFCVWLLSFPCHRWMFSWDPGSSWSSLTAILVGFWLLFQSVDSLLFQSLQWLSFSLL